LKEEIDEKCKICGNETKFKDFRYGYKNCCSDECSKKLR
jgi:hypothetical protein